MSVPWHDILSVSLGGWVTAFIIKLAITRSIRDLDRIARKIENVSAALSVVETKLESLERMKTLLFAHDRKLIELEMRQRNHGKGHFAPTPTS